MNIAGQEKFRSMVASYYHGAHGIILAYDTTNRSTFDNLGHWLQEVKKYARRSCPVVLVGTKTDLKDHRAVSEEAVREFAERYCGGANSRVETSAKTNDGVDQAFQLLAEQIFLQTVTASDDSDTSREGLCLPQSLRGDALTLNRDPCSC
jgi:small GTP-binding protein